MTRHALVVEAGDGVGSLAAVRALGAAGWRVDVASPTRALAARSRFVGRWHPLPRLREDGRRFVAGVAAATKAMAGAPGSVVVFPAGDAEVLALSEHRERLAPARFPYPPHASVVALFDKWTLTTTAQHAGLGTPPSALPTSAEGLDLPLPVIVKARRHWAPGHLDLRTEAVRCSTRTEAAEAIAAVRAAGAEPMVQQAVTGALGSVVMVRWEGRLLGAHRQVASRIEPPGAGSSVRAETVPMDEALLERCVAFLDDVGGASGLVQLEFVLPDDGIPQLIDANPRIYGSLALAGEAGWNPLDLLGRATLGLALPSAPVSARRGARYHWLEADLRHIARRGTGRLPSELAALVGWARTSAPRSVVDRDLLPRLLGAGRLLAGAGHKVRRTEGDGRRARSDDFALDVVSSHARPGGSERLLERLLVGLGPDVVRSLHVLEDGPVVEDLARAGGRNAVVLPTGAGPLAVATSALRLRRSLRTRPPGVIHANGVKAAIVASLAAGRRHPMVWMKHDVAQSGRAGRWAAARSARIVGVSAFVLCTLPPQHRHKTDVVPVGLPEVEPDRDGGRRRLRELTGRTTGPFLVILGRLDPGKGHADVFEAMARARSRLAEAPVLVCAGGEDPAHLGQPDLLGQRVRHLGLDADVVFAGHQPRGEELAAGADIVVVSSRPQANGLGAEGLSMAALEALQAGVPVVGYDIGGLPEVVGECGVLVPVGDIDALAEALVRVLGDDDLRRRLGADGPARVRSLFSERTMIDSLRRIYAEVAP